MAGAAWSPGAAVRLVAVGLWLAGARAAVVVNEVADKGTSDGTCGGEDWVELANTGPDAVDLADYVLADSKGPEDNDAYRFPSGARLGAGGLVVLCKSKSDGFRFGVGSDDLVTLWGPDGALASSSGELQRQGAVDFVWARFGEQWEYTAKPTPGAANELGGEAPAPVDRSAELAAQERAGAEFFGWDAAGALLPEWEPVKELHIELAEEEWSYFLANASHEEYRPAKGLKVVHGDGSSSELAAGFRMRPRGQWTLWRAYCEGSGRERKVMPWLLDLNSEDKDQSLFGVKKAYLRAIGEERSAVKEWLANVLLARWGLPHLRTRHVALHINGEFTGLYHFMEAPDQEYVFQRSFPSYDPETYSLYKFKTFSLALGCTNGIDYGVLQKAEAANQREDEMIAAGQMSERAPYRYERGEHRGNKASGFCRPGFFGDIFKTYDDVARAWLRHDKNCPKMLVEEGLVDRDLGKKASEASMEAFLEAYQSQGDAGVRELIDASQFLRALAAYGLLLAMDSPAGNYNNFLLADTGDGSGWKLVPYDLNNLLDGATCEDCEYDLNTVVEWSVDSPTCGPLRGNRLFWPAMSDASGAADPARVAEYRANVAEMSGQLSAELRAELAALGEGLEGWAARDPFLARGGGIAWQYTSEPLTKNAYGEYAGDTHNVPFNSLLMARSESVAAQRAALEGAPDTLTGACWEEEGTCPALRVPAPAPAPTAAGPGARNCGGYKMFDEQVGREDLAAFCAAEGGAAPRVRNATQAAALAAAAYAPNDHCLASLEFYAWLDLKKVGWSNKFWVWAGEETEAELGAVARFAEDDWKEEEALACALVDLAGLDASGRLTLRASNCDGAARAVCQVPALDCCGAWCMGADWEPPTPTPASSAEEEVGAPEEAGATNAPTDGVIESPTKASGAAPAAAPKPVWAVLYAATLAALLAGPSR